jgi:Protein of unknown function (DUF3780)
MAKTTIAGFDCADIYREHAYLVRLSKGKAASAQVFEVFGRPPEPGEKEWAPETILRCELPRATWDAVSGEVRAEFNRRLKADDKPAGRWGADDTAVQRLLGKELLVLLWAIEQENVSDEETAVAIRNWLGLKPEERWWLYTMTAAATGFAHQAGRGWRNALRDALCFGTRKDAFHLAAVVGRGTLAPQSNKDYVAPAAKAGKGKSKAPAKPRRKKTKLSDAPSFEFASSDTKTAGTKAA